MGEQPTQNASGHIIGYRLWRVLVIDGRPVLGGPYSGIIWRPSNNSAGYRMVCLDRGEHDAPHPDCGCGYYATRHLVGAEMGTISGAVVLGGRVIEEKNGWRGQMARILALVRPNCLCGVPADALWYSPEYDPPTGWACCRDHGDWHLSNGYRRVTLEGLAAAYGVSLLETDHDLVSLVWELRATPRDTRPCLSPDGSRMEGDGMSETGQKRFGFRYLSADTWYGPGYHTECGVCGEMENLITHPTRFWDPDDGWRVGVLCGPCTEYARDRGPRPGDRAYRPDRGVFQ